MGNQRKGIFGQRGMGLHFAATYLPTCQITQSGTISLPPPTALASSITNGLNVQITQFQLLLIGVTNEICQGRLLNPNYISSNMENIISSLAILGWQYGAKEVQFKSYKWKTTWYIQRRLNGGKKEWMPWHFVKKWLKNLALNCLTATFNTQWCSCWTVSLEKRNSWIFSQFNLQYNLLSFKSP